MKKILFFLLLIPYLNYSQHKDILMIYPAGVDIELVDGFIFKYIWESGTTNKTRYEALVKDKYSSDYYLVLLYWSFKRKGYTGVIPYSPLKLYDLQVNIFRPNYFKTRFDNVEYTQYFSKNKRYVVNEFGREVTKDTDTFGQLKSIDDVELIISDEQEIIDN
jgi:hypothetical protein